MPILRLQVSACDEGGVAGHREKKEPVLTKPVFVNRFDRFFWCNFFVVQNGDNLNFKGGGVTLGCVESPPSIKLRSRHGFVG